MQSYDSKKKLKVAQITPYYYPSIGGVSGVAQYISEELVMLGHKVNVITSRRDHKGRPPLDVSKKEIINGVNVFRYRSILNIGHMSFFPGLVTHLLKNRYDVIHYHSYRHPLCDISSFFGKLNSSVNILHGHGPFFEVEEISKYKEKIYALYDRYASHTVLKWTDIIIALNSYEQDRYQQIGVDLHKVRIVPNAADNSCFEYTDPFQFLNKNSLIGKKIILFVGTLNSFKRPDLLIKALPKIIKEVPNAHLVLVGPDGGMLDVVRKYGREFNVEDHFTCTGPLIGVEKQMAFSAASIFALPSDWESFGVVIIEAMAHSLPVVCSDARGPANIIEDEKTGFIIKKGDVESLAKKIVKILLDENLKNKMAGNAGEIARKRYSANSITENIEKIYFELIEKKNNIG